jgi:2-oxoglutarate ferredoxin oxidoreductase subunit gamma
MSHYNPNGGNPMRSEIKIGGFGGQGVILSGYLLGRAASIYDNKYATMIQAFGPEARGGAASAGLIVSSEEITYPYVTAPTVMVIMSQEAYSRFTPELATGGILITESELVQTHSLRKDVKHYSIPATRFAEELGKKMVLNVVMMGFATAISKVVSADAMKKAIEVSVPPATIDLNLKAFQKGYDYGATLAG